MPRVFIADGLEAGGIELLKNAGIEVDNREKLSGNDLKAAVQAADGMIVRSATKVTADLLEKPGKLRCIVRAGVGVDTIDVPAATRKGLIVMNTPGGNTTSTAEQTITLMMSLSRHTTIADASMKAGKWDRKKFMGSQLAGKTLGVIGLGRIGREVARRAAGLDMKIVGFDPFLTPDRAGQLGIEAVAGLEQLLPRCDYLTVHTPLTAETTNLVGAKEFALMKKGARVINCARGGIYNEEALVAALKSGHLAGAALDVYTTEPVPAGNPMLTAPNIVLTPHLGASTFEAQEAVGLEAAQLLIDFLTKGAIGYAVNMAPIDRSEMQDIRQYVDLARRLGLLHAQMCQGTITKVELNYKGTIATRSTKLVTAAFLAGLLEYRIPEGVNIVNAELMARERGIDVTEKTNPKAGDFSTLVKADVTTDKKTYTAAGTLFGHQYLRLVQLGPHHLDSYLDGLMLIFTHVDVPGLIGFVGTIFGKHNVNIAQMRVGREKQGGEAIGVLNLDNRPSEAALAEVRTRAEIKSVSLVELPEAGVMPSWFA
ncbi:MAG TPA: phosphoglycerate dehydrogenase [Gemmataceae bacterium]|jgi:D-3-phosphoglycerate dehydrogenase|nr:phosphoglycerate dehydrogenase [Gemmataceae bacterium]